MKNVKHTLSLALAISTFIAIIMLSNVPIEAAVAGTAGPVIIDFTTKATAEESAALSYTDRYDIGNYSIDEQIGALSLKYSTDASGTGTDEAYNDLHIKFLLKMKQANMIADGQKYMVATYKTNIEEKTAMKLNNMWGVVPQRTITLTGDVSVSYGEWVRTEAINIDNGSTGNDNYYKRFNSGSNGNLIYLEGIDSEDKYENKHFYIKEIAFFKDKAQAEEYYAGVELNEIEEEKERGAFHTGIVMMLLLEKRTAQSGKVEVNENVNVNADVIYFTTKTKAEEFAALSYTDAWHNGKFSFNEEEGALSLDYSTAKGTEAAQLLYNDLHIKFRLKMKQPDTLADGKRYMVITYKTNIEEKAAMKLNNMWGVAPKHTITLADDISVSDGEWVRTEVINIDNGSAGNDNYYIRFNNVSSGNLIYIEGITSEKAFEDKYFYIKEIAFFESEKDAKTYYRGK